MLLSITCGLATFSAAAIVQKPGLSSNETSLSELPTLNLIALDGTDSQLQTSSLEERDPPLFHLS